MMRHCAFVRAIRVKSATRRLVAVAKRPLLTRITRPKPVLQSGKSRFCKPCVIPDTAMFDSSATPSRHACGSPHSTPRLTSIIATLPARLAGQAWPLGHRRLAARSVLEAPAEPAGPSGIEAKRQRRSSKRQTDPLPNFVSVGQQGDGYGTSLVSIQTHAGPNRRALRRSPMRAAIGPARSPTPYSARTTLKDPPCPAHCTATGSST